MATSKYNTNELTKPQMLAERMCERIAKRQKKALPYRFWQMEEWKKTFQLQVIRANQLLKEYTFEEISRALANPKAAFIYSFGSKKMWIPYLEQARKQIAKERENARTIEEVDESSTEQKPVVVKPVKKNLIMDLD